MRKFRKVKEEKENSKSTYNADLDSNSMYSLWLCKECGGESIQNISPLISDNMNTLVSEIFVCKKIKRAMTLYTVSQKNVQMIC